MKKREIVTEINKITVYFIDIILVLLGIYLAFLLKFDFEPPKFNYEPALAIMPFIVLAYLIYMFVFSLNDVLKLSLGETIYSLFLTVLCLMITTAFITFFARGFSYPRSVLLISTVIQFILLTLWRIIVWRLIRRSHGVKDCLIIGNDTLEYVTKKILIKQRDLYRIKYVCNSETTYLDEYLNEIEVVFICGDVNLELKKYIIDRALMERKSIYIVPDIYELSLINSKLSRADDIPMLKVQKLGLTMEAAIAKRFIDLLFSLLGIIIASPIMLVTAVLIKLEDRGNVFFTQERVTLGGKLFNVIKFRTMVINAEKMTGPVLAGEDDPRITRIGKYIRATRIDELPQLFNVLMGDMSIVGPRPERPYFIEQFNKTIPNFKYRTLVKAGLTGLAQIMGKYTTTPEDKARYDIVYIKRYSIWLDLKLILETIKIMFMKESSSGVKDEITLMELIKKLNLEITIDKDNLF